MKKVLFILIFGVSFFCCKKDLKNQITIDLEKTKKRKELRFSLYNSTDFELQNITIGLPDTVLTYKKLEKHSQTKFIEIKSAYRYGLVRFYDNKNRKYYIQPIDYIGEKLYKKGEIKFVIKSIDTIEQFFELDSNYIIE